MAWWQSYERRANRELNALQRRLPSMPVFLHWKPAKYCSSCRSWEVEGNQHLVVYVRFRTALGNIHSAMIVYPCEFPHQIPAVYSQEKVNTACGHCYSSGELCLTDKDHDSSVTGVTVLDWAKDWFECYDIWQVTGIFPPRNYGRHRIR